MSASVRRPRSVPVPVMYTTSSTRMLTLPLLPGLMPAAATRAPAAMSASVGVVIERPPGGGEHVVGAEVARLESDGDGAVRGFGGAPAHAGGDARSDQQTLDAEALHDRARGLAAGDDHLGDAEFGGGAVDDRREHFFDPAGDGVALGAAADVVERPDGVDERDAVGV